LSLQLGDKFFKITEIVLIFLAFILSMIKKIAVVIVIALTLGTILVISKDKNDGFYLIKEEGQIFYKVPEKSEYTELLQDEITLPVGTAIKTEQYSSAHVLLQDNSLISLDENTEVTIKIKDANVLIEQTSGKSWNRVETLSHGHSYDVTSRSARASANGTIFGFWVEGESIITNVEDGIVALSSEDNAVLLEEGDQGNVVGQAPTKSDIQDNIKKDRWYIRNKILDVLKRSGLDNIFLKDKVKKELARTDLVETRYTPVTEEIKESIFEIVTSSNDESVCEKSSNIPDYVTYSKYSELYHNFVEDCDDSILNSEELDALAKIYSGIK
jgi:hypothetical protein